MPLRSPGTSVPKTDAEIVDAVEDSAVALAAGSTVGGTAIASTDDVRTDAEIVAAVEASATLDLDAGATIGGSAIVSDADLALVALDDLADVSVASPSDQDVLTWDDGTSTWVAQAAGGGSGWPTSTGTDYAGTPYEQALVATTNGDLILSPNGNGALIAQVPDGTGTGGNTRGQYAVDFQRNRGNHVSVPPAQQQVASGNYSVLAGGEQNVASGTHSAVPGGYRNVASGSYSIAAGSNAVASGGSAVALGGGEASGISKPVAIGSQVVSSGFYSTALGQRSAATQYGEFAHSSGSIDPATPGRSQFSRMVVYGSTTDATPTVLGANGVNTIGAVRIEVAENDAYTFHLQIVACQGATGDTAWWDIKGCIKRPGNAATTALVGSLTTVTDADAGASTWAVAVTADTTNAYLKIEVTGEAGHNIRWVATCNRTKVNTGTF